METLKYIIETNCELADRILAEYPKVYYVPFLIEGCVYEELKQLAFENEKKIEISDGIGQLTFHKGNASFMFKTKPLIVIVSEPIIVEG